MALPVCLFLAPLTIHAAAPSVPPGTCETLLSKAARSVRKIGYPRGVSAIEMIGQDFYTPSDKGAVVGVSGYTGARSQLNGPNGRFLSGQPFADGVDVFHLEVSFVGDFYRKLKQVYDKRGPIYKLAIVGHGAPGACALGQESLSLGWTERNAGLLKSLPDDLFAADAQIILLSCNCSQGNVFAPNEGVDNIRAIFSKFVRKGARVVASRRNVFGSTTGFAPSNEVTEVEVQQQSIQTSLRMKILRGALTPVMLGYYSLENLLNMVLLDEKSKTDFIDVIEIPRQL